MTDNTRPGTLPTTGWHFSAFILGGGSIRTVLFQPPGALHLISRAVVGLVKREHLRGKSRGSRGVGRARDSPGGSPAMGTTELSALRAPSGSLFNGFAGARLLLLQTQQSLPRGAV